MRLAARAPGLALMLASIACAAEASTFEVAFMTDPVGPKALPYLVAVVLALAGAHATVRPRPDVVWPSHETLARTGAATAAFLLYAAALPAIGFFASTTFVVVALAGLFGETPVRAVPAAAVLSGALWLIFVQLLGLPLPIGDLWIR